MHILAHFNATWLGMYIGDAVAPWHADHLDYPRQQQMPNKIMCSMASQNKGGTHKEWRGQTGVGKLTVQLH